jgi:hypothetical protein
MLLLIIAMTTSEERYEYRNMCSYNYFISKLCSFEFWSASCIVICDVKRAADVSKFGACTNRSTFIICTSSPKSVSGPVQSREGGLIFLHMSASRGSARLVYACGLAGHLHSRVLQLIWLTRVEDTISSPNKIYKPTLIWLYFGDRRRE